MKKRLTNVRQYRDETDRAYIERVDKLVMEREPLGDEAKVLEIFGGLRMNTKLWKQMNTQYPTSYTNFRH